MTYDIIIIGAGAGGLGLSTYLNKAGLTTLLINESDERIGGDCLNFGCVPSKALIHTAKIAWAARHEATRFGLASSGKVDIGTIICYIKSKQEVIRAHENATYLRSTGLKVILGRATFASPRSVLVEGKEYVGKNIVIATGSRPQTLSLPGEKKMPTYTNETIFDITTLPKHFVFVGAGPISSELGQAFHRLGSEVTFLIRGKDFLKKEDPAVSAILLDRLRQEGITFLFQTSPKEILSAHELLIETEGQEKTLECDALFAGIGRVDNIDTLDLDKAGIKRDKRGKLVVDAYLRTTNPHVYVIGDAAGGLQFTHAAELHIRLLLHNFFSPIKKKLNTDHFSWVTFTDPEVATFGLNECTLNRRGISYQIITKHFTDDDRAIVDENTAGFMKLFVDKKRRLLGGTMVATNAGELFQELVLANTAGLKTSHLSAKIYPYPTATRVIGNTMAEEYGDAVFRKYGKWLRRLYR